MTKDKVKKVMKASFLLFAAALAAAGCTSNQAPVSQNTNAAAPANAGRPQSVIAHTTENQPPVASNSAPGKWSAGGDPIDTAKFDGTIAEAEKMVKSKPDDAAAKKLLSEAYYDRGDALTKARQYASALGDYRRSLKYDPENQEAKDWIGQIVNIYQMLKKEPPKEGEEPPPLPFKK